MNLVHPSPALASLPTLPADLGRSQRLIVALLVLLAHAVVGWVVWHTAVKPAKVLEPPTIQVALVTEPRKTAAGAQPDAAPRTPDKPRVSPAEPSPARPAPLAPPVPRTPQPPTVLASPRSPQPDEAQVAVPVAPRPATVAPPSAIAPQAVPTAPQPSVNEVPRPVQAAAAQTPRELPSSAVRYKSKPLLEYPTEARYMGESGTVHLRILVDVDGIARQVKVTRSSGSPALDRQAVAFIRAARFYPYVEAGVPREFWVPTEIEFNLE